MVRKAELDAAEAAAGETPPDFDLGPAPVTPTEAGDIDATDHELIAQWFQKGEPGENVPDEPDLHEEQRRALGIDFQREKDMSTGDALCKLVQDTGCDFTFVGSPRSVSMRRGRGKQDRTEHFWIRG